MKILHFADLHLDTVFAWTGSQERAARRRHALRRTLEKILCVAQEESVDAILCAGDLYEQDRFSPDTAAFLCASLETVHPLPVYLAPGNHDWLGPNSLYRQVNWSPNVHIFSTDRLAPVEIDGGLFLWGAAHLQPAGTGDFLRDFEVDREGVHLALFHGSDRDRAPGEGEHVCPHAPFHSTEIRRRGLAHAFLGHFHRPCRGQWHTYPGNPEPLTLGEDGERGVVIATVHGDGGIDREWRQVAATPLHHLELDVTGVTDSRALRRRVEEALEGRSGLARVRLYGELSPEVDLGATDFDGLADGCAALRVETDRLQSAYDFDAISREGTVRGQFVRDVQGAGLPADRCRRVLLTGLRALEGRSDLEVI